VAGMTASSAAGPPRVTKRRAETRAKLMDVCKAAGYTRGAFYSQFDSLDELFFTLYDERAEIIARQVADAMLAADDAEATIERVSATLLLDREWLLIKTDFLLHAARHSAVAERLAAHRSQLRDLVERRLRDAGDQLALPDAIGDVSHAARAVVAAYDGVTVQLLLDGDTSAARAWLTQLLTALLDR
jgi:AcrR family transcriptional regulator